MCVCPWAYLWNRCTIGTKVCVQIPCGRGSILLRRLALRYVLPVLWMTSRLAVMSATPARVGSTQRRSAIDYVRDRGRSLMSMNALKNIIQFESNIVCDKFSLCENFQRQSCSITIRHLTVHKYWHEMQPFNVKFSFKMTHSLKIADSTHASRGLSAVAELLVNIKATQTAIVPFSWRRTTRECVFSSVVRPWPWPHDLDIRPWLGCSEIVRAFQKWSF